MSKNEKCTCKACKNTVFLSQLCKFIGFLLPLSSWLLKLPIREFKIWRRQRQRQRHKSMIWLVEWRKTIVLHVRHAFCSDVLTYSAKRWRENFTFEVLTTTRARSRKSFTLCLYMKITRTKQAKVHFAYFAQCDQHGIIAKDLTQSTSSIFLCDVFVAVAVVTS